MITICKQYFPFYFLLLVLIFIFIDVDAPVNRRQVCGGSQVAIEKMLQFGRDLHTMSVELKRDYGTNSANKKMLQVYKVTAFVLFIIILVYVCLE